MNGCAPFVPLPVDEGSEKVVAAQSPLAAVLSSTIALGAATQRRNLQVELGASQIGIECDRQLSYRLHNTVVVNTAVDPMRSLVGTGVHLLLQEIFTRLDGGSGRFLTEQYVSYRGVPGQADLYDGWLRTVIDWKTTSKARIADYVKNGLPQSYRTQIQIYAAGLQELGLDVRQVAVAFLPYDGPLSGLWTWQAEPDRSIADTAIERVAKLREITPEDAQAIPSRACSYCPYYSPRSTDVRFGCPAKKGTS